MFNKNIHIQIEQLFSNILKFQNSVRFCDIRKIITRSHRHVIGKK